MTENVRFHFDPACPWAWQTSKWMREVARVRDVDVDWRFFSLKMVNSEDPGSAEISAALKTLALVQREHGNAQVAALYEALGRRVHDEDEGRGPEVIAAALEDVGLDAGLLAAARGDRETERQVRADHNSAVDEAGCFGVPTILRGSGRGIFGPVVSVPPRGEGAGELWDHVSWLADQEYFFELKRERDRGPGDEVAAPTEDPR